MKIKISKSVFFSILFLCLNTVQAFRYLPKKAFPTKSNIFQPSFLSLQKVRSFSSKVTPEIGEKKDIWFSADDCRIRALFGETEQPDLLPMNTLPQSTDFFEKASLKELEDLLSHYTHLVGGNIYTPFKFYGLNYTGPKDEAECRLFAKIHFFNTVMAEKFIIDALEKNDVEKFKKCVEFMNALKKELEPYKQDNKDWKQSPKIDSLNHNLTCYVLQFNKTPHVVRFLEILHQTNQIEFKKLVNEGLIESMFETFDTEYKIAFGIKELPLEDKVTILSHIFKHSGANNKALEKFFEVHDFPYDRELLMANPHAIRFLQSLKNVPHISSVVSDVSLSYCAKKCIKDNLKTALSEREDEESYTLALQSQNMVHGFRLYSEDLEETVDAVKKFRKKICEPNIPNTDEKFDFRKIKIKILDITGLDIDVTKQETNKEFLKRLNECKVCKAYTDLENALEKRKEELLNKSKKAKR